MNYLDKLANKVFFFSKKVFKRYVNLPTFFRDACTLQDYSCVTTYLSENTGGKFSNFPQQQVKRSDNHYQQKVSLISVIKNEVDSVEGWFERILSQTRLPDEIIIVDGGSVDGTKEKLEKLSENCVIPICILLKEDGNIARNRNIAIEEAQFPIIAVTDFGCFPKPDWLEKIILPFEMDEKILVSAGVYEPLCKSNQKHFWLWSSIDRINPQNYLPPGGSIAFRKEVWAAVGGYPEWLTLTGEDTCFDIKLKGLGGKWAFSPEAIVEWIAPDSIPGCLQKLYSWAIGDGESGFHAHIFWKYAVQLTGWLLISIISIILVISFFVIPVKPPLLWSVMIGGIYLAILWIIARKAGLTIPLVIQKMLAEAAQVLGFIKGAKRRKEVNKRRYLSLKGVIFVLAGVPMDDTGGGSRGAQIANELLRQNFAVIYINKYPKYESRELNLKYAHPNLFLYPLSLFKWEKFADEYDELLNGKPLAALLEFPLPEFLPLIENIKKRKGKILYDLIDDWQTSLGGDWYTREDELKIINASDALTATATPLQEHLNRVSNRTVRLLPNAVDDHIFNASCNYVRPLDLPDNKHIIIYIGALWGEWFDWELLEKIAKRNEKSVVCVIGDYRGQYKNNSQNLIFLGLKAQKDLPAYLAFSNVAIVPWKSSKITQATSPLKIYEYLAMHCPVIAPDLPTLHGIPGIALAKDHDEFVELTAITDRSLLDKREMEEFIKQNNWKNRVEQMLCLLDIIN